MAVKNIIQGQSDAPRLKCDAVEEFTEETVSIISHLADTLDSSSGIGLSAPQIGYNQRILVAGVGPDRVELVNPVLVESKGLDFGAESCLSFPHLTLNIERPKYVVVEGLNRHGQLTRVEAQGPLARALIRQMEWLDGVHFYDNVSDEELMSQLFTQFDEIDYEDMDVELGAGFEDFETEGSASSHPLTVEESDAQLALDLLSDAGWKLTLAAELMRDLTPAPNPQALQSLDELVENVNEAVQYWEDHMLPQEE